VVAPTAGTIRAAYHRQETAAGGQRSGQRRGQGFGLQYSSNEPMKSQQNGFKCRFGVGDPDGAHSMVWVVCANRGRSDLYIAARPMGGVIRASIHALGQRHVRLGDSPYDRWSGAYQLEGGATLEFLMRFPTAELRRFPVGNLKKSVTWLTPAPESQAVEIGFFYFPPESQPVFSSGSGSTQLVCTGRLADLRQVWLVARMIPATDQSQALREIVDQMRTMGISPSAVDDGVRLTISFNDVGVRGWTELRSTAILERRRGGERAAGSDQGVAGVSTSVTMLHFASGALARRCVAVRRRAILMMPKGQRPHRGGSSPRSSRLTQHFWYVLLKPL